MRKRKLLFSLLALASGAFLGGSGAMAQSGGWDAVYNQTQTTSDDWTAITEGTTQGKILGAAQTGSSATSYYYVTKSLNFTNNRTDNGDNGNSGLKIHGTVYLYVPAGLTITCEGANADGRTGAGAGIELASGNTLYIIGGGTVNAYGGNAANGKDGDRGENASFSYSSWIKTGAGGTGGNGGGGAGAGIGTRGGTGGTGGAGGAGQQPDYPSFTNGTNGTGGTNGNTAGSMGNLYVANGTTVNATGGAAGTSGGSGGWRGTCAVEDSESKNYSMAGGGGGGGGGFGGAAANKGTGGPGGGGGGGGAGGTQERCSSGYLVVYAPGGKAGKNADGSNAGNGEDAYIYGDWQLGWLISNSSWSEKDWDGDNDATAGAPGSGGSQGNGASGGTQNTGNLTYNITYNPIRTNINGMTGATPNSLTVEYTPSGATDIVLPQNEDGFQWVLSTYGKSCAPDGVTASEFATATKAYYGGDISESSLRTIVLGHVYGNLVFQELLTRLDIAPTGNNEQALLECKTAGYPIDVRLMDRTIYRDNHWNTICLPFNMTSDQISTSPLKGATIYKMNETVTGYYPSGQVNKSPYQQYDYGHPVLLFWFDNVDVTASGTILQAGKPYLVKWAEGDAFTDDGNYKDNTEDGGSRHELDFEGMTITQTVGGSWTGAGTTDGNVIFQGTLSQSAKLLAGNKTRLVLGVKDGKDKLYYPSKNMNVRACRGYFIIPEAAVSTSSAPEIVMGFDDGETTSIQVVNGSGLTVQGSDTYYNLNGQRLTAPQKGINIINGKKVVIK